MTQRRWPRRLVNFAVALVVLAVAVAAFSLAYSGVHAIALAGGVSPRLARIYPGLFDAVLVIACVAAVMLRDGRWWARCWAWLVIIVVLAAVGTTDTASAMNYALPHRQTQGVVAAAPIVAVLLAFSLLITLLRSSRTQSAGAVAAATATAEATPLPPAIPTALPPGPPIALPAATAPSPALPPPTMPMRTVAATQAPVLTPPEGFPQLRADTGPADQAAGVPLTSEPPEPGSVAGPGSLAGPDSLAEPGSLAGPDSWDADGDARLAGQVYPVPTADSDRPLPSFQPRAGGDGDADGSARQPRPPELDDDAPPFATAPFAPVPRLNRVRATPVPPQDTDADD